MGTFTVIPQSTFDELQMDAGVLLSSFDPSNPAITDANIISATTGGFTVSAVPTFSDMGSDIDNCPENTKELKHLDSWAVSVAFTALGTSPDKLKLALGCADVSGNKVTPRRDLSQSDFYDAIWWVGDRADGGLVAVKLINALSTDGFSLQTTKNGKGQVSVNLSGHVSIDAQSVMPMEFYSIDGTGLKAIRVTSFAGSSSGKTAITTNYTLASGESYKIKLGSEAASVTYEQVLTTGWTAWNGSDDITATTGQIITVAVVVTSNNKAHAVGHCMVTAA